MAVIPFPNIEPQGSYVTDEWELRSITARHVSPLSGVATTLERPGAHWAVRPRFHNLSSSVRALMQQYLANCRGHANRSYLPFFGWTRRGSFPAPELFTNGFFANGTTGWTANSTTLTAADGIARLTAPTPAVQSMSQSVTMVQYAPYALRSILHDGRGTAGLTAGRFILAGSPVEHDYSTSRGLGTIVRVNINAGAGSSFPAVINASSGYRAGDFLEVSYASLARCALVDNGPNVFDQSDAIDHANWTKNNVTVTAQYYGAPDGTTTGERVIENTANTSHSIDRSFTKGATAEDWCVTVAMRIGDTAGQRRFVCLRLDDGTSSNFVQAFFDLLNGTISTAAAAVGTYTNARAFVVPLGNNWYQCSVVGRTSTGTAVRARTLMSNDGTSVSYTGDGASNIGLWRLTMAQSSVPVRLTATTTAAVASGTLQTGSALHLKGLPASTNGLLLQGDPAEIIIGTTSQLVRTRGSLNSDAAGLGYWQFEAPLRVSPSDGAGVIICNPLCKMMLDDNTVRWSEHSGGFCDLEFAAVEDTYPT